MASAPEKYNETAVHFYASQLPDLMDAHLKTGPLALVDIGCGDGPLFEALERRGAIGPDLPVYAVDLEQRRLATVAENFPYIKTVVAPADDIPQIEDQAIDFVVSTMVMEHVPDDGKFLREIARLLKPDGKAYITTVYKKKWAWYFRKRDGESVLDRSHIREYTDLEAVKTLVKRSGLLIHALEVKPLWFPLVDPLAFRLFRWRSIKLNNALLQMARRIKVPIIGFYSLNMVLGPAGG